MEKVSSKHAERLFSMEKLISKFVTDELIRFFFTLSFLFVL